MTMMSYTQGKCERCRVAFRWTSKTRVQDATCPHCFGRLARTSKFYGGEWVNEEPLRVVTPEDFIRGNLPES